MSQDRFAERRRVVAEDRARRSIRRMIGLLAVAGLVAGIVYLINSPLLSIATLDVRGVSASNAEAELRSAGIVEGEPLAWLDLDGAVAAISSDPWVEAVSISRDWPTTVVVEVEERSPVAMVGGDAVSVSGVVLPGGADADLPAVAITATPEDGVYRSQEIVGALRFFDALRSDLRAGARITTDPEGLVALVSGFRVRLGRPVDMAEKARALAPVMDRGVPEGAEITLIAPTRPAVLDPDAIPSETTEAESGEG